MGLYNILHTSIKCESCHQQSDTAIQFKYGELWLHQYYIGDAIRWGRRNEGIRGCKSVVLSGIGERCPGCGYENEVLIFLQNDVMMSVMPDRYEYDFAKSNGYYLIIEY